MQSGLVMTASPTSMVTPTSQSLAPPSLCAKQRESCRKTVANTTPPFLSNLGKPTLRGIRKCPQCGIYNGTRGLSCKNKACGVVFRDGAAAGGVRGSKGGAVEVVRVVIDGGGVEAGNCAEERAADARCGGAQVFSVCQRGRGCGASQHGFVELVSTDTAIPTSDGTTVLTRVNVGRCFLPTCRHTQGQKSDQIQLQVPTNTASNRGPSNSDTPCVHVKQAMECQAQATPLPLKSSILEGLQASAEAREELWRLATESPGPLVQRVNKDTLVVKCQGEPSHPLGLLHLTVASRGSAAGAKAETKVREGAVYQCACQGAGIGEPAGRSEARENSEDGAVRGSSDVVSPGVLPAAPSFCLHFYACVCAFASDDKLAAEFTGFLSYCSQVPVGCSEITAHKTKRLCLEEDVTATPAVCPAGLGVGKGMGNPPSQKRSGQRKSSCPGTSDSTGLKIPGRSQVMEESLVTLGFQQWLASITERIHQTMHYQFDGKPEPLVFHVPQVFFNALQHRLSLGSKKRRLPNTTSAFVRNDELPHGTFCKYTWQITNLMQVKRIFDTPELPLELTQSFVKNSDGSYSPFSCPPPHPPDGYSRPDRPQAIRPLELRTFLTVGLCSAEQKDPIPFVIEWIPDILPRCRVGELRISFQYGHQPGEQA
ncbi:hypothetical protein UPYG_G00279690 [Umbra pygmaea]|uniref:Putative treble-clef zinc-finger domain-containing protein n=1 Tax=Umbra pygmaea TaxID=75934 RepID=A0ABD0WNU2_UMBPY